MENVAFYEPPTGGRASSPKFRGMAQISDDFEGLPEGVTRLDLLHLVKDVGSAGGFTPRMVNLLEYYVMFTRDCDWTDGNNPIVYQSLMKTAKHFRVSERQIQYLEKQLFEVGALTWHSSGNNKRFGVRNTESGEIKFACGIDLSPLAALRKDLERKKEELQFEDEAWFETKRQISWYRSRIRSVIAEAAQLPALRQASAEAQHAYNGIDQHIRTYMTLDYLQELLGAHQEIHNGLLEALAAHAPAETDCGSINELAKEYSSTDAKNFVHSYSTNNSQFSKENTSSSPMGRNASGGSVAASTETNSSHRDGGKAGKGDWIAALAAEKSRISWKQVLAASSDRFKAHFPMEEGRSLEWSDVVNAAHDLLPILGISNSAWLEACMVLGRDGAALAVMIIDQKAQDPENQIRNPGGYLRGMTARARKGELNLHGSIFGLLKREGDKFDA